MKNGGVIKSRLNTLHQPSLAGCSKFIRFCRMYIPIETHPILMAMQGYTIKYVLRYEPQTKTPENSVFAGAYDDMY